jgi:CRISPR-associated protein Cas1
MRTLYAHKDGLVIRKSDQSIVITEGKETIAREPVASLASIVVMGNSQVTEQALRFAASNNISIVHADRTGHIVALTNSFSERGSELRMLQYRVYFDEGKRLAVAKHLAGRKLETQESFLKQRRALQFKERHVFKAYYEQLEACTSINQVLGVEGEAARYYFNKLNSFSSFYRRSRRPARDVVNALLNLTYSLMLHRICSALVSKGLDIQIGFLHAYNTRRPSLGLDVLELFRAQADAFVVTLTNRKEFTIDDFELNGSDRGLYLSRQAFKKFMAKFSEGLEPELAIEKEVQRFYTLLAEMGAL